eukprot:RCo018847
MVHSRSRRVARTLRTSSVASKEAVTGPSSRGSSRATELSSAQKERRLRKKHRLRESRKLRKWAEQQQRQLEEQQKSAGGLPSSQTPAAKQAEGPEELNSKAAELLGEECGSSSAPLTLKYLSKLKGGCFRLFNEMFCASRSDEAKEFFVVNPAAFDLYHEGYASQRKQWPVNPL